MPYCTPQEMVEAFGEAELIQLTNAEGDAFDPAVAQRAIDAAQAEIDAYLASRYKVPFADPPLLLKDLSLNIARQKLYGGRVAEAVEVVRNNYKDAVAMLRDISCGKANLGPDSLGGPAPLGETVQMTSGSGTVFNRGEDW